MSSLQVTPIESKHTDSVLCITACDLFNPNSIFITGGEEGLLCFHALDTSQHIGQLQAPSGDAVTSIAIHPNEPHTVFTAAGQSILSLDLRKGFRDDSILTTYNVNQEEINSIAVNAAGTWLAAADDSGEIQLVNLAASQTTLKPSYRTLRRGHINICSSVAFLLNRTTDLITGGLDCALLKWDYARIRLTEIYNLNSESAASTTGQAINPPMVHCIATGPSHQQPSILATARGDGCIALYNSSLKSTTTDAKTSSSGKKKKSSSNSSKTPKDEDNNTPAGPLLALLQPHTGGHTAAANCVCFHNPSKTQVEVDSSKTLVASVGNDRRLLLWDWQQNTESEAEVIVGEYKHKSKLNWVCSTSSGLIVGDVGGGLLKVVVGAG